ncbi:uncharacterized protein LOC8258656 [Ricinus communis]|uniref:uncharacterized protein LOC8258656 n=1 Tax=Ricinus communis TaxID=3988 RepID=UPI00201AD6C5|nr:uncharacterized protein LOC8258656 [Ricinus communis]
MGTYVLLQLSFTTPQSLPFLNPIKIVNPTNPFPSGYYHQPNSGSTSTVGRIRINLEDELYTDPDDDGFDEFGFGGTAKQRVWWSDNDYDYNYDDDDDDDVENEFWAFKVIRAFGWMVPAIGISLLLGTGPNPFFMALAVPLGQTALSLVFDKVWGSASSRPKPRRRTRTRTRKKPFVRPASREETNKRKEENKTHKGNSSYQSWMASDSGSFKKGGKKVHKFGGWDELDDARKVPREKPRQKEDELPKQQIKGKLSRTRRVRDRPLFLRLLIALFPFLGSWTRLLF